MTGTDADARVQDLARLHHGPLVRAMALICGSVAEAEDAVQDAFLALWQAECRGEAISSPRAWLTTASMNRLRSGWRRRVRQDKYLDNLALEPAGPDIGPDLAAAMALRATLATLPTRQREATVLYYLFDLSVDAVAAAMGTSPGMVKNALFRARRTMATSLGEPKEVSR